MHNTELESAISGMEDVGLVIKMVDDCLENGNTKDAARSVILLAEIFGSRIGKLKTVFYGGESYA